MDDPRQTHPMPRHTLVLAGDAAWARDTATGLLGADALWVGDGAPAGVQALPAGRAREYLGRECGQLVFDAHAGFDPDAFGAVTGSLRGGGRLLLLTPPLDHWAGYDDPDKARYASHPHDGRTVGGRFLQRLVALLRQQDHVSVVSQGASVELPVPDRVASLPTVADRECLTQDQADAVAALLRVAHGHRRRPLVLTADRGRGKSAALGIAAARLLASGTQRILLTAPRPAAVAEVFARAQSLLPAAERHGNRLCLDGRCLSFVPPDELLRTASEAELLLVDEAAAIPVPLLSGLLQRHARIAFASTVHGYEGSGRGFALRFRARLDQVTPQWHELTMTSPVRYGVDDPLERLIGRVLLLDAEPAPDAALQGLAADELVIERIGQDALAADEPLLGQLFGLLVQAHYQTRPSDLRQLLDAPDLSVWVARRGDAVAGACLVLAEGGLAPDLAEAVAGGRRRPQGHLVAQALAAHSGCAELAVQRTARVMRIAVHPVLRRQGLGRRLLAAVSDWAGEQGMDWWGASFAADPDTLAFWQAAGCGALRLGASRDTASGTHSAILLSPLSGAATALYGDMRQRFLEGLRQGLCDAWRELEPLVAARLLSDTAAPRLLCERDRTELGIFAEGRRDLAATQLALWRMACDALAQGVTPSGPEGLAGWESLLVRRVLQAHSDAEVVAAFGLSGRKQLLERLRAVAGCLTAALS